MRLCELCDEIFFRSSSDIESDDEVIEEPSDSPEQTGSIKKRFYTIATSMRLMVAHEIQQEFEEVQSEEEELQEEGKEMENTLRRKTISNNKTSYK